LLISQPSLCKMTEARSRWLPLESNPDVMTRFLTSLGLPEDWAIIDVIGFDEELLAFIPQPVAAVILLYPSSVHNPDEEGDASKVSSVYFMTQTIHNACGTIALLHSLGNKLDMIPLKEGSVLKDFYEKTAELSPLEKGQYLENNEAFIAAHEANALRGQTSAPNLEEEVDHHFVALVEREGRIYLLNGDKVGPLDEGPSSPETFLSDAAKVCLKFMAKNPECLKFTAVALAKSLD